MSTLKNLAQPLERDESVDPWDRYVRPHFDKLVEKLKPSLFLSSLISRGVVGREDQQRLKFEVTSQAKVQMLLMEILPYHLPWWSTFETFCDVLAGTEGQRAVLERYICPPGLRLKTQGAALSRVEQDRTITEKDISQVSSRIAGSWDKVASSLDPALDSHDIRNVREDLLMRNDEKMAAMLRKWVNRYSDLATTGRLRLTLEKLGERKVADDSGLGIIAQMDSMPAAEAAPPIQPGDRTITLEDIVDVASRVASYWEKVAVKLNPRVGDEVIRNARENMFITHEGRMKEVLETWLDRYSGDATYGRLQRAINLVEASLPHHVQPSQQLSDSVSDGRITMADINEVSVSAAPYWQAVASNLDPRVSDDVIRNAAEDRCLSREGRMQYVLKKWLEQYSNEATVSCLSHAVESAKRLRRQPAESDCVVTTAGSAVTTAVSFNRECNPRTPVQAQADDGFAPFGASRLVLSGSSSIQVSNAVETNASGRISDDEMRNVCKSYGNYWEKVVESLQPEVDADLVERMKCNPFLTGSAILYEVLKLWSEKHADAASPAQVEAALIKSGLMS